MNLNRYIDSLLEKRNTTKTTQLLRFCQETILTQDHGKILDLGCGNGLFAKALMSVATIKSVVGVDVIDYTKTDIEFIQYAEGEKIPLGDNSVDLVFIVEVLHHSNNAVFLLKEAKRVARKNVVIFEDVITSPFRLVGMKLFDILMNMRHGVNTPLNFKYEKEWETVFEELGMSVEKKMDYSFYSIWTPQKCRVFFLKVQ